ncbi:MAG: ribosomal-protein-alanine N-acetyltransferase [Deltaproteobacteria bacterium]|nr:ribosomal-protein-alanine N-acetyltransferase [Deltaproteobacteria bacterium]
MEEITLCPVTEDDLEEVLSLERASFNHPWNSEHIRHEITSPLSFPLLVRLADGVCAGYICPMLVLDEGQILNVAVHPSYRGQGIGRILVKAALEEFRQRGASIVDLEVRPSNAAAISLYIRCGFVTVGRRKAYYENGEDAILMKHTINEHKENHHAV